ncbi:MAG: CapA family protein [Oscillospiraceae bacterium]|jgi:poly-gamma-glutamate synthesis protein (capsule biosynthesis protein)|nr:CapA family protein [Oscillospiraceae bacterium]
MRMGKKRLCLLLLLLSLPGCTGPAETTPAPAPPPTARAETPAPPPTPTPPPDLSTRDFKIQMAGDILLHSGPVKAAAAGGDSYDFTPFFSEIAPFIDGDLAICNMESPVDAFGGNQNISSYPMFNVPFEILPALRGAGFNFLLTANNHAFDKRWDGLTATRRNIEAAGFRFTGTYETQEQYDAHTLVDLGGLTVGILNYSDADNGMGAALPADKRPFAMRRFTTASTESVPAMSEEIQALRAAGAEFVIAALHWGAEYRDAPNDVQEEIAARLCDAGADVILGGHSHCVQPVRRHEAPDGRSCLILYSLGNFFADQIALKPPLPKTQYGMLVSLTVRKDEAGRLRWGTTDYLPTLTHRYAGEDGGTDYRLIPVYAPASAPEGARTGAQAAFDHVTGIVGEAIPVMNVYP